MTALNKESISSIVVNLLLEQTRSSQLVMFFLFRNAPFFSLDLGRQLMELSERMAASSVQPELPALLVPMVAPVRQEFQETQERLVREAVAQLKVHLDFRVILEHPARKVSPVNLANLVHLELPAVLSVALLESMVSRARLDPMVSPGALLGQEAPDLQVHPVLPEHPVPPEHPVSQADLASLEDQVGMESTAHVRIVKEVMRRS